MTAGNEATIKDILSGHTSHVVELVGSLRDLVKKCAPELVEEPKRGWGNITYKKKSLVCAITPQKEYATLYFYRGTGLTDPQGLLEGSGKALRHIKIHRPDDVQVEQIAAWIQEAVQLDKR